MILGPGARRGRVVAPPSKSHAHRLLIAAFLAGCRDVLEAADGDSADIAATKRCLAALAGETAEPVLDCGESGSTLRFLSPVAAALGKRPKFVKRGRLAERPCMEYSSLEPGVFELSGGVSSQFATGLLFALPLLGGDSEIRFSSPLQSKGYVRMTLDVLKKFSISAEETASGFFVPGRQRYSSSGDLKVEGDWSGAAFWLAMNALGSNVEVSGLDHASAQPDAAARNLFAELPRKIDVSQCPDLFPALAVAAAAREGETLFTGTARLRIKECDRAAAMLDVLQGFGVEAKSSSDEFRVKGTSGRFRGGSVATRSDHRIAMATAVGATRADSPVEIDDAACAAKSYPRFFAEFCRMEIDGFEGARLAAVSLGSNIEPRGEYLKRALDALSNMPETALSAASGVVETEPVDVPDEFSHLKFLNQAALLRTRLDAREFSARMHEIEDELGRVRTTRNGPRTIDIDLVDFDSIRCGEPDLVLPHPRAAGRDFVRRPLAELGFEVDVG